jgi:hypothetical protein
MYCVGCGRERTVPASAADPGRCVCGETIRMSTPPFLGGINWPLVTTSPQPKQRHLRRVK